MHLNVASVAGFILCLGIIITGIATNGGIGTIMNFIHVPSMLVTFGGALFAVMITSDSFADYLDGLKSFPEAFHKVKLNEDMISEQILEMSSIARKEGLLVLEERADGIESVFLKKGIRLIVDGTDPELVKDILETELIQKEERIKKRIHFWEDLGAYAPAWGMVGTLLGLINMMRSMGTDAASIGSGMALALITTLYGSVLANWVCIPISRRMEKNGGQESLVMELTIEGVLSIQAGESPTIIKEKLRAFLEAIEE